MVFPAQFDLSQLDGSNGFTINGIDEFDTSGTSVSGAGDVNGDGIDDIIIGAPGADPNGIYEDGESYVVFGSTSFGKSFDPSSLDGSNGFVFNGTEGTKFVGFSIDFGDSVGSSVSSAGDVNGDGIDDIIIGANLANGTGDGPTDIEVGESYVIFGSTSGFSSSLNRSDLNGNNGFAINGIDGGDRSGRSVSSAGDVNGDGWC